MSSAQTVTAAIAKREAGPVTTMFRSRTQFAAVLPKSVDADAFLGTMAGALYADPKLMAAAEASPDSLYTALMRCAALGHMPGTDEFYLTPRKKGGKPTVLGIEGYRGIVERMYRSGAVAKVVVREVCAKDKFKFVEGEMDRPQHAIGGGDPYNSNSTGADFFGAAGSRDRGPMVGVYAYAELTTGAVSRVVILTRDDVMAARDASDSKDSDYSPWNRLDGGIGHPEFTGRSMWWKTAARRLEPWVPTSAEYRREMLRASAAASTPAANGHAAPPEPVYEAEIVPDPEPESPAAPKRRRAATDVPAPPKALGELQDILKRLELGTEEDERLVLEWIVGSPWTATTSQVRIAVSVLGDFEARAEGDLEQARTAIWTRYNDLHGDGGGEPDA